MKIVLLSPGHPIHDTFPNGGGIQYHILGLAREMAGRGHEVHIICHSVHGALLAGDGVIFHPIQSGLTDEILSVLLFSKQATTLIESLEPDVVSAFERFSAYYPSRSSWPMAFTTENYDGFRYYLPFAIRYQPLNFLVHPWKRSLEEGVMNRSRLVVALTASIEEYLASIGISHVEIIPNGVSSSEYENLGDGGYVLYAGRLDAPKGVDVLIRAFAMLEDPEDHSLHVVGRGRAKPRLMKLARELGISNRVLFRNWMSRHQLVRVLGGCTAFVLPSLFEALPLVLLEAMACGKPVIGSRTSGPQDVIEHERNGLLFARGDADDLAAVLGSCLQQKGLRTSLGQQARRTVESAYDFKTVGEQSLRAYSQIAA